MSLRRDEQQYEKPLNRGMWWFFFLVATVITSFGFQTFRVFTLQPTLQNGLLWLLVMTLLIHAVILLAYDSYVQEKKKDTVKKPVKLFEWMIQKRFLLRVSSAKKGSIE